MTGDLFARASGDDGDVVHCYLQRSEDFSMWAFVEERQASFPILTKLWRSVYGPEFEIDPDALLEELGNLERGIHALAEHPVAVQARLDRFMRQFHESFPRARVGDASVDSALAGIQRIRGFLTEVRSRGWHVWNSTD